MIPHVPTSMRLRGLYMSTMRAREVERVGAFVDEHRVGIRLDDVAHDVERALEAHRRRVLRERLGHLGDVLVLALGDRAESIRRAASASSRRSPAAAPPRTSRCRRRPARRCARCCRLPAARCRPGRTAGRPTTSRSRRPTSCPCLARAASSGARRSASRRRLRAARTSARRRRDCSCVSGSRPLAIDIGRYGMPVFSTSARMSASACA